MSSRKYCMCYYKYEMTGWNKEKIPPHPTQFLSNSHLQVRLKALAAASLYLDHEV